MDPQKDSIHKTLDILCKIIVQVFIDEKGSFLYVRPRLNVSYVNNRKEQ